MSMVIQDAAGNDVTVSAQDAGGRIDFLVRGATENSYHAAALSVGLLVEVEVDEGTEIRYAEGIDAEEYGVSPGEPTELDPTPGPRDNRYHVNIRLSAPFLSETVIVRVQGSDVVYPRWKQIAIDWTPPSENGIGDAVLLDSDLILRRDVVWL